MENRYPQHRPAQGHQQPDVQNNNISGAPYNFSNQVPHEDFASFFNHDANPSFNPSWDTETIDPQIQATPSWHPNHLNSTNSLHSPNYGLQHGDYSHAFSRNQNAFDYAAFGPQQHHSFAAPTYDPALTYNNEAILDSSFGDHRPQDYDRPNIQGQTISPSALQSYPNQYANFQVQGEPQPSQFRVDPQLALRGPPESLEAGLLQYDEQKAEEIASAVPSGSYSDDFLLKDMNLLCDTSNARKFTGYILIGSSPVASDEPKVILPKQTQRKTIAELKRKATEDQGQHPWDLAQRPLMKRIKLSPPKPSRPVPNGSSTAPSDAQMAESSSATPTASESEEDSESEDDSEDEDVVDEPSPLPASRPTDSEKSVEYDVIKAVWAKKSTVLSGPAIRTALGAYWTIIKGVRDSWKATMDALQIAEEKKDQTQIDQRRNRAAKHRRVLETALRVTLAHGHRDIVERLAENTQLFLVFYQFIADRFKAGDLNGNLITSILQLIVRCTSIDEALFEKTKLDKVIPKLLKRGDEKIRALAQKILNNVANFSKQKSIDSKGSQTLESTKAAALNSSQVKQELVGGLKKAKDGPSLSASSSRKGSITNSTKSNSVISTKTQGNPSKGAAATKPEGKSIAKPTAAVPAPKNLVKHVVARPSAFFSLQSASKKPGTSNSAKAAQLNDAKNTKVTDGKTSVTSTSAAAAAAPKPAFSFAETMANLTKPKETPVTPKSAEVGPPETEDEKRKRLRKEERRKLRVSFKPDDSLSEIRLFVHDPEEELGHDESMRRDVGDIGSEGRMLKMHKELDTMDDEEDSTASEEALATWEIPSAVDFTVIPDDELARNCTTRGGSVEVKSHERAVQEQRELTTLMAFYTSQSDIPLSPREPPDPYSGEPSVEREFGPPSDEIKIREAQFFASHNPLPRSFGPAPTPSIPQAGSDISSLLQILNAQNAQPQQPQIPQPQPQPQATGLEAIFAAFSGNNQQQAQPQASQPVVDPTVAAALAMFNQQNQMQPQSWGVPAQVQTQQQPTLPQQDLGSLLAQLTQGSASQVPGYNYQNTYQAPDNERKRGYEHDDQRGNGQYSDGKRVRGTTGKKFFGVPIVPCKFWQEGKCKKGDDCTFLHE